MGLRRSDRDRVRERGAQTRDQRIDALRGLAIALVVLGHVLVRAGTVQPSSGPGLEWVAGVGYVESQVLLNPLLNIVYTFHVPLFAFVSGYVMLHSSAGHGWRFLRRRFGALMVPYFAWLVVAWLITGPYTSIGLARFVGAGVVSDQAVGSLWFLYAVFVSAAVFALVRTIAQSEAVLAGSAILVGLFGLLPLGAYESILGLSDVAWIYPFVVGGFLVASHRAQVDVLRIGPPASAAVWVLSTVFVWPLLIVGPKWWFAYIESAVQILGVPGAPIVTKGLWAVARVVGAFGAVLFMYYAFSRLRGWGRSALAWLGRRSIGVYAIHGLLLIPLSLEPGLLRTVTMFCLSLFGSILLTCVLERFRLTRRILLGAHR